jgi:hypothetical protein
MGKTSTGKKRLFSRKPEQVAIFDLPHSGQLEGKKHDQI